MTKDFGKIAEERGRINQSIRTFFMDRGYVEVEVPILVRSPGMEPNLVPFETNVLTPTGSRLKAALVTSPEYAMKKLLGSGMEKIFTITKVFRNEEELGGSHNPEFTMLEWYQQGADYQACMDETEELVRSVAGSLPSNAPFPAKEGGVIAGKPFERIRVRELFLEHVGVDLNAAGEADLRGACAEREVHAQTDDTESDLFYRLFLTQVEPNLAGRNVFVYDYPRHQAALSTLTPDGRYGQRFELYLDGRELCNGFTELTDAAEQRRRFEEEAQERSGMDKPVFPVDEDLLALLPSLRSPTFGNALGIDRLHMAVTGKDRIEDVLLFPAGELFRNAPTQ